MDNAVTQTVPTPLVPAAPGVAARWRALPARTQTLALLGLAALAVVLVALWAGARGISLSLRNGTLTGGLLAGGTFAAGIGFLHLSGPQPNSRAGRVRERFLDIMLRP